MKAVPLSTKALLCYSALAVPLVFAGMPIYIHAPDYFATQADVPLSALGISLLLLRLIDAVQDPLIGRISDQYMTARKALMIGSALVLVVSFMALFQPLGAYPLAWFVGFMFLATSAYSVLSINFNTVGGLWCRDSQQKTRITTTREGLGLVGLLLAVLLPSFLQQSLPAPQAFWYTSLVLAILMVLALGLLRFWYDPGLQRAIMPAAVNKQPLWRTLQNFSRHSRWFFLVYLVSLVASSIPAVLVLFYIRDRLNLENYTGVFLGVYFIAGACGMPLWRYVSSVHGKYRAWAYSMLLAISVFVWAFFLDAGDFWQYACICVLSGIAFGAELALPPSILADYIEDECQQANASLYFGALAFVAKLALALASVIALSFVDWMGLKPGAHNTQTALVSLSLMYAVIPCLIKLLALWLLYQLRRMLHEENFIIGGTPYV